jgi:hypothetical protein
MIRLILCPLLLLALFFLPLSAEEVTIAAPPGAPWWGQLIVSLLTLVVVPYLVRFLRAKTEEARKSAELAIVDTNKSLIEQRGAIAERLKAYLWGSAAAIAEREFPRLAAAIVEGRLRTADDIKAQLREWGRELRTQAIVYFRTQGLDLVETFGPHAIDDLVERAANAVSPFPGKETAVALLKDGAADLLLQKGVEWMREKVRTEPAPDKAA